MTLGDVISKLLEILGLKKSETDKLRAMEEKLRLAKAANIDKLEALKEQIISLEKQVKSKNKEYDQARGDLKRVLAGEIKRLFNELDLLQSQEKIIGRNIKQLGVTIGKLQEIRAAKVQGVDQDTMDSLAVELEDIFKEMKTTDIAAADLAKISYEPAYQGTVELTSRTADLERQTSHSASEPQEDLSPSELERMRRLAEEE